MATPDEIYKMNEAYKVLSDTNERTKYDQRYKNQSVSINDNWGSSAVPLTTNPTFGSTRGIPTGAPSVRQVKILNLDNLSTRVIVVNNIYDNKFPHAQYCDNGLYYGIEKNNHVSLCNKTQWDSIFRWVIKTTTRGTKQSVFVSANLKKLIILGIIFALCIFFIIKYGNNNPDTSTPTSNTGYIQSGSSSNTTMPEDGN